MGAYMNYVIVDLEMNKVSGEFKEERRKCTNEIIEIGAVIMNESFNEISSFKTYVKPRYSSDITPKVKKLTGISWDMVEDAPEFEEAFRMFVNFCDIAGDDYQIIEWSESDHTQILNEMFQKDYVPNEKEKELMTKWHDFQREFGAMLGRGKSRSTSLKEALLYAGEDFVGNEHDALFDARNTAELFSITKIEAKREKALQKVIDIFEPKSDPVTLGDLFDFGSLSKSCESK